MLTARLNLVALLVMTSNASVAGSEQLLTISRISPSAAPNLRQFRMVDPLRGWSPMPNGLWTTTDGGHSWREVPLHEPGPLGPSWGVTADGGAWTLTYRSGMKSSTALIRVLPDSTIRQIELPCIEPVECSVAYADFDREGRVGLVVALVDSDDKESRRISVFRTDDGGWRWTKVGAPDAQVYRDEVHVRLVSDRQALLEVGCDFYITEDLGVSWIKRSPSNEDVSHILSEDFSEPFAIRFTGVRNGWLRTATGWILESRDGGESWQLSSLARQAVGIPLSNDQWIDFSDNFRGVAVLGGRILVTQDGGQSWHAVSAPDQHAWAVSCVKDGCLIRSETNVLELTFPQ